MVLLLQAWNLNSSYKGMVLGTQLHPPPYHPASNGLAERAVQIFKHSVAKLTEGTVQTKISTFLFNYRITPKSTTGMSPSELLLGRRLKSALDLMKPNLNQKDRKLHMIDEQLIEHLILEKKFMQEIMVKERSVYQPRYFKK